MLATFIITLVSIFVADYIYSKQHDKLPLFQKIKKFFRDYKSEIKKIVWPSRKTTIRNTIIVLVMCLVLGGFIWALDFGLARLLSLALQIDL
ncbi:MAG TPA: preprotein translocase subunit SecE [Ruminococcaceae bacterium]|nr:preprotein translocase subunit SecE [Oscillospiraceae bacterium]